MGVTYENGGNPRNIYLYFLATVQLGLRVDLHTSGQHEDLFS